MKQLLLTSLILLLCLNANALIVSVNGYGDIEETPMQITITEAHQDPLSGKTVVEMKGQLLCQGALEVTIQRSAAGMTDEFCCGQCLTGNGQMTEVLYFTPGGMSSWYSHYYPAANDNQQVVYTFFRPTKAARAFRFAAEFRKRGIVTPHEMAYIEQKEHGLFTTGYFISEEVTGQ